MKRAAGAKEFVPTPPDLASEGVRLQRSVRADLEWVLQFAKEGISKSLGIVTVTGVGSKLAAKKIPASKASVTKAPARKKALYKKRSIKIDA